MGNVRRRPKRLGEKLLHIRESLGLSQTEMLRRLETEDLITYHQISGYESGKREPPLQILLQYARVAGVCLEVIVDDDLDLPTNLPTKAKHSHG